ncbi:hypothetical protein F5984_03645 [Rudanella paleaurantiibacter]|uniref:histidine kinase n=1 Tax=Rudanella paleaurantiibacter TaxID=2614655 RepID=A0A7J5U5C9_9BACT|nr:HAMP domain-containing sensor histidine kinase [Rudanella paleaurantiibacter]KAB7733044.1 hypothetical protein F5984_03645 [Rudanella paleaurantiibacter]
MCTDLIRMGMVPLFFCSLLLNIQVSRAQSFADTYPVNKPDSLVQWLRANPKAHPQARLKALITLERTYTWNYHDKVGEHLPEISRLAKALNHTGARASAAYIQAYRLFNQNRLADVISLANQSLKLFGAANDHSGQLHAYGLLVLTNSTLYGNRVTSSRALSEQYLGKMETLLRDNNNVHDFLTTQLVHTRFQYGEMEDGARSMRQTLDNAAQVIQQRPDCAYARYRFGRVEAIYYGLIGEHEKAYALNKQVLQQIKPEQGWEMATLTYNLATDCYKLNRIDEGIALCQHSIAMLTGVKPVNYAILAGPYTKYRELMQKKGDFVAANRLADSVQKYNGMVFLAQNDQKMLELQVRYETERKQAQIAELKRLNEVTAVQNRMYLIGLGLAMVVIGLVVYLSLRLHRANARLSLALAEVQQLNKAREQFIGIIAHDMRKPLVSFQGLADLINDRLKQRAYADIGQISQAIDSAGVQIETMLDNLLRWALSQREAIPYHPDNIRVTDLLHRVTELHRHLVQFHNINIAVDCPSSVLVWADVDSLELIVRNLIDNALKAIGTSGCIQLSGEVTDQQEVQIRVWNSGRGVSPDKLLFLQGVLTGRRAVQIGEHGLGLGLLLVRDFVARNKGRVTVEPGKPEGICFVVTLPKSVQADTLRAAQTEYA